jgi:hypothetical protein
MIAPASNDRYAHAAPHANIQDAERKHALRALCDRRREEDRQQALSRARTLAEQHAEKLWHRAYEHPEDADIQDHAFVAEAIRLALIAGGVL